MKRAWVTGASRGIGFAFAQALAEKGYALTLLARSQDELELLATQLPGKGHRALALDLATDEGRSRACAELGRERVHLLVNNAGVGAFGDFAALALLKQQRMMRINCDALVELSHAFLAQAEEGDALINVASTLGLLAMPKSALYTATKSFVVSLSECLWYEQKARGVYVMGLCPGMTRTDFFRAAEGEEYAQLPSALSQTPEEVVAIAMRQLEARRHPIVVCGAKNRLPLFLTRMISRKTMVKMMGRMAASRD